MSRTYSINLIFPTAAGIVGPTHDVIAGLAVPGDARTILRADRDEIILDVAAEKMPGGERVGVFDLPERPLGDYLLPTIPLQLSVPVDERLVEYLQTGEGAGMRRQGDMVELGEVQLSIERWPGCFALEFALPTSAMSQACFESESFQSLFKRTLESNGGAAGVFDLEDYEYVRLGTDQVRRVPDEVIDELERDHGLFDYDVFLRWLSAA